MSSAENGYASQRRMHRRGFLSAAAAAAGSAVVSRTALADASPFWKRPSCELATGEKMPLANPMKDTIPKAYVGSPLKFAFSADGKSLATLGDDKAVKVWSWSDGKLVATLVGHKAHIRAIAFSPDSKLLASANLYNLDHTDTAVKVWSVPDGKLVATLEGHKDRVNGIAFSHDSKLLISPASDKTIRFWSLPDGKPVKTVECPDNFPNITISPDGKLLASSFVAMTPDGKLLATWAHTVWLWSLPEGELVATLEANKGSVGSSDKKVRLCLWSLPDRKLSATLDEQKGWADCIAIPPDGKSLASVGSDRTVKLWSLPDGKPVATLDGYMPNMPKGIAISPDSKLLAFRNGDKTVKLWSLPGGKPVATLEGPKWLTAPVAFSPDGKFLVSGYLGGSVLLWELGPGKRCWALFDPKVPAK